MTTADTFRTLRREGTFVMPNPWDRGSARILQEMGFPALATTSAGIGRAIGKDDQQVTRDELVAHVADLAAFVDVPLNVDAERLFPGDEGGIAETVRLLADARGRGLFDRGLRPRHRHHRPGRRGGARCRGSVRSTRSGPDRPGREPAPRPPPTRSTPG
jgi:hypothetical protein